MGRMSLATRQKMIEAYMPLAQSYAIAFVKKNNIENHLEDFISIAYVGLCKAGKAYFKNKGVGFAYFAKIYIIGAMADEFRKMDHFTRGERKRKSQGEYVEDIYLIEIPEIESDAEKLFEGSNQIVGELILDNYIIQQESLKNIKQAIESLSSIEKVIFSLHMMNDKMSYKDIGFITGLSESRISQLFAQSCDKIRSILDDKNERK